MERGLLVFGLLFLVLPLGLAAGIWAAPAAAFGLTVAMVAVLAVGFFWAVAFVDLD